MSEQDRLQELAARRGLTLDALVTLLDETAATLPPTQDAAAVRPAPAHMAEARYEDRFLLARGGMGEVRVVADRHLRRGAVMKIVHAHLAGTSAAARLRVEAEITGQLQHPGVVPVYDSGVLPDGRPFYVMREIRGQTLQEALRALRDEFRARDFRRLIEALRRACETLAYAHSQGIIHRDIKPANLMLEAYGSVLVLDWGLARRLLDVDWLGQDLPALEASLGTTRAGTVMGTPGYMSPEQAAGHRDAVGPPSDVYALGVTLGELLAIHPQPPLPISALVRRAMQADPADRPTAEHLAEELEAWLDGARRRAEAMTVVHRADQLRPEIQALRERADAMSITARETLAALPPHAPDHQKAPSWAQEDAAERLREQAALHEHRWEQTLHHALRLAPDLSEAHTRLADHYRRQHEAASGASALRLEALLNEHDRGEHSDYLRGEGILSLETDPLGAEVILHRFVAHSRRLQPERVGSLGHTPLRISLPHGSLLLTLHHPDCVPVTYPVLLPRGGQWDRTPPGATAPAPVRLPRRGSLSPGDRHVPAGWCWLGGDPEALDPIPLQRVWLDDFVIQHRPVTMDAYRRFLQALPLETARLRQPLRQGVSERVGAPMLAETDGHWQIPEGILADAPVTNIRWEDACAYADWWAAETRLPWRLPHSAEWEKAARGVDRRLYPWGDFCDPTWANLLHAHPGIPTLARTEDWHQDVSLYGVMGLVGNIRDLCCDPFRRDGIPVRPDVAAHTHGAPDEIRAVRGGTFAVTAHQARSAGRLVVMPSSRYFSVGFRLSRSL